MDVNFRGRVPRRQKFIDDLASQLRAAIQEGPGIARLPLLWIVITLTLARIELLRRCWDLGRFECRSLHG